MAQHLALYREFRPKTFDEVISQEQVVKTLKNQIETGNISHAYLFCGTRGTGKTSCAKIFARAVNCLHPKNGSPCFECEVCKNIMANGNLDIVEIDAASNNRVDEIRDLRDKVNYMPTVGKYKVYIIDEVHMLTDSAFNALLKTLEEPPSHIIFILATTEPQKLPATILSRCMRFDFKFVGENDLVKLLKKIFDKLGIAYDEKALHLIARAGKGAVRDTLSIAEMCKTYANDNLTYKAVEECLGVTDENTLFNLANLIVEKDGGAIIDTVDNLYNNGKNLNVVVDDLCEYFKNLLAIKLSPNYNLELPENTILRYKELAEKCDAKYLLDCLKKLTDAQNNVKFSLNSKAYLETLLISLFFDDNYEIEMLKQKLQTLESKLASGVNVGSETSVPKSFEPNGLNFPKQENFAMPSQNITPKEIVGKLVRFARENGEMLLFAGLNDVENATISGNKIMFQCKTSDCQELLEKHRAVVLDFLSKQFGIETFETSLFVDKSLEKQNKLSEMLDGKVRFEN